MESSTSIWINYFTRVTFSNFNLAESHVCSLDFAKRRVALNPKLKFAAGQSLLLLEINSYLLLFGWRFASM